MKKTFVKRFISMIMSMVLVMIFVISSYASAPHETYHGTIVLDSTSPDTDLSGIEIKVYSAQPVYDTESLKLLYYGETYAFSVWTDENGSFSFVKPTDFCSITIETASLPDGYGINRMVQFIADGVTSHTFLLADVSEIDVTMESDQVAAHFYAEDGKTLYVDYQIEEFPITMESLSSKQIKEMSSYDVSGKVITSDGETPYSFPVDLSEYSLQTKTDYFYQEGMISEEKKIDVYCDILLDKSLGVQLKSGTIVVNEILAYKKNVLEKREKDVGLKNANESASVAALSAEKVDKVVAMTNRSTSNYSAYIECTLGENFVLRVLYDETLQYYANNVVTVLGEVYSFFITGLGFQQPFSYKNNNIFYFEVTCKNDTNDMRHGFAVGGNTAGSSYITINYATCFTPNEIVETVSHEFHHAIMAAYGFNDSTSDPWVREGFATMASTVYSGFTMPYITNATRQYLTRNYFSIYDSRVDAYGTMVYPLYIYEALGGWNVIKRIYTIFSSTEDIYASISDCYGISTYSEVFNGMFSWSYKPSKCYDFLANTSATLDNAVQQIPLTIGDSTLVSSELMAGRYRYVTSTTDIGTLYVTCSVLSNNGSNIFLNKITEHGNGLPEIETVAHNFTQITFSQQNFGSAVTKMTIVTVNPYITGTAVLCRLSVST